VLNSASVDVPEKRAKPCVAHTVVYSKDADCGGRRALENTSRTSGAHPSPGLFWSINFHPFYRRGRVVREVLWATYHDIDARLKSGGSRSVVFFFVNPTTCLCQLSGEHHIPVRGEFGVLWILTAGGGATL